jgi:hypothetical protein
MSTNTQSVVFDPVFEWGHIVLGGAPDNQTITRTFNNPLSDRKPSDFHKFSFSKTGTFEMSLSGLSNNANVELIRDANRNGRIDPGETIFGSYNASTLPESMRIEGLGAGNYFLRVYSVNNASTDYTLEMKGIAGIPGEPSGVDSNSPQTAINILGQLSGVREFKGNVNADNDRSDYYRFTLNQAAAFQSFLTPQQGDTVQYLYHDVNRNRVMEPDELITFAKNGANTSLIMKETLAAGDYYLQVNKQQTGSTDYKLQLNATPISQAKLTIDINELRALEQFDNRVWGTSWHKADFYGTVTIDGKKHNFGTFQDRDVLTGLKFTQAVDPNKRFIGVEIEVYDADSGFDDYADISPWGSSQSITGRYDTVKNQFFGGWGMPFDSAFQEGQSVKLQGDGNLDFGFLTRSANKTTVDFSVNYTPVF